MPWFLSIVKLIIVMMVLLVRNVLNLEFMLRIDWRIVVIKRKNQFVEDVV